MLSAWTTPTLRLPSWRLPGGTYRLIDLPRAAGRAWRACRSVLRLLLENVLRCRPRRGTRARPLRRCWPGLEAGTSEAEIAFQPRPRADARHHQHAGAGGHRGDARRARRGGCRSDAAEPGAAGRRVGRPLAGGRGVRARRCAGREPAARAAAQRRALSLPALGVEGAARRAHPSARHRHHAHDQPRAARHGGHDGAARRRALGSCPT